MTIKTAKSWVVGRTASSVPSQDRRELLSDALRRLTDAPMVGPVRFLPMEILEDGREAFYAEADFDLTEVAA